MTAPWNDPIHEQLEAMTKEIERLKALILEVDYTNHSILVRCPWCDHEEFEDGRLHYRMCPAFNVYGGLR